MEELFLFPLTIKEGRVYDAKGTDVTEAYQMFQCRKCAEQLLSALEQLTMVKQAGKETRHMLYIDHAYYTIAVIETFVGDNLSERLQLSYAGCVQENQQGIWYLEKVNRRILPLESLVQLYALVGQYNITLEMAEDIWDHRTAMFYLLYDKSSIWRKHLTSNERR
ncbi:hypothetical protein LSG31_14575 [Fodinisporobacter ferrooxydans]|uniref:Uncharacterized protein n=1 Tax=Fodinisporobacter ferrooxydans TaxID=2901836 RepID=A0ABY4CI67_9BACL|nr:hypothetical protein LSG31_14575 [Alicyclobacillaceae bacterium MYW30-H2]